MSIECAFMGTLARDAEAKTSKAGKPYVRFSVRVGDGDSAQFVSVMCFAPSAEAEKLVKGAAVYIEGSIKLDEWTGQDGAVRHGLSVLSWHCRLAEIGKNRPRKGVVPARTAAPLDDEFRGEAAGGVE